MSRSGRTREIDGRVNEHAAAEATLDQSRRQSHCRRNLAGCASTGRPGVREGGVVVPHETRCRAPEPVRAIVDPKMSAPVHLTKRHCAFMAPRRFVQRHVPYRPTESTALNARK